MPRVAQVAQRERDLTLRDSSLSGDYAFLHASDLHLANVTFSGKYSFQYVEGLVIKGGAFDTKDAFWHARRTRTSRAVWSRSRR